MIKKMVDGLLNLKERGLLICLGFVSILIIVVDGIVYATGGTEFAFTHLMYIPIIISGFFFNRMGAAVMGLLAGLSFGPLMPLNVAEGTIQEPYSWMLRGFMFMIISLSVGFLFERIKLDKEIQIRQAFTNAITGYPNATKLKLDLNTLIGNEKNCSIIVFKLENLKDINSYLDYKFGEKSLIRSIEILAQVVGKENIYSVFTDQFAVLLKDSNIAESYLKAEEYLTYFKEPILIDNFPMNLVFKGGILNYPEHGDNGNDLFENIGRTLDQKGIGDYRIAIYDENIAKKNKEKYKTIIDLSLAIKNGEFYIVYQPKLNLKSNKLNGIEALLRWENDHQIGPGEFIKIAEDVGLISEITKWVLKKVMEQLIEWEKDGITVRVAINISSKDLNRSFIEYLKTCMNTYPVNPDLLEFELTERVIIENEKEAEQMLNLIKDLGIRISLDDFGTGYNSLLHLVQLPIDYLKIDKVFVDHVVDINNRYLIEGTILSAHQLGIEVIAEGVEMKEQLELLKKIKCDTIQGYYFSKPLSPEKFIEFYYKFDKRNDKIPI